jgi:hypothetical protein
MGAPTLLPDPGDPRLTRLLSGLDQRGEKVTAAFPLEVASMSPEVAKQAAPLHTTVTVSRSASSGNPRRASSRRS